MRVYRKIEGRKVLDEIQRMHIQFYGRYGSVPTHIEMQKEEWDALVEFLGASYFGAAPGENKIHGMTVVIA